MNRFGASIDIAYILTFFFIYIYIGTHTDMQKQCSKEKELKASIMQLQASNSEA